MTAFLPKSTVKGLIIGEDGVFPSFGKTYQERTIIAIYKRISYETARFAILSVQVTLTRRVDTRRPAVSENYHNASFHVVTFCNGLVKNDLTASDHPR